MLTTSNSSHFSESKLPIILYETDQLNRQYEEGAETTKEVIGRKVKKSRLRENPDGSLTIVEKHPAYLFGKHVVRPAIETSIKAVRGTWSLLSTAASAFENTLHNLFNPFVGVEAFEFHFEDDEDIYLSQRFHFDQSSTQKQSFPLHEAVRSGDLNYIQRDQNSIDSHDINEPDNQGFTPLDVSVFSEKPAIFQFLIQNGADIFGLHSSCDYRENFSTISLIIELGRTDLFDLLIASYPQPSEIFKHELSNYGNLLHIAIKYSNAFILNHLLTKHHSYTEKMIGELRHGKTPMHLAAKLNDADAILVLKDKGADINARGTNQKTPLHYAAENSHSEALSNLIRLGATIDIHNANTKTPHDLISVDNAESSRCKAIIKKRKLKQSHQNLSPPNFSAEDPENLVFKGGGGLKDLAYLGAIRAMEEKGVLAKIERIGAPSTGAIISTFLSLGASSQEIEEALKNKSWTDFLDISVIDETSTILQEGGHILNQTQTLIQDWDSEHLSEIYQSGKKVINSIWKLYSDFSDVVKFAFSPNLGKAKGVAKQILGFDGLCKGEALRNWIEEQIYRLTEIRNCTFGELNEKIKRQPAGEKRYKYLYIYGTNLDEGSQSITCFSTEDPRYKNMIISDAVRISASIYGVFASHSPWFKNEDGVRYERSDLGRFVDGSLLYRFPLETFDQRRFLEPGLTGDVSFEPIYNKKTLGVGLFRTEDKKKSKPIKGSLTLLELVKGMIYTYFQAEEIIRSQVTYNRYRIIKIEDCGFGTLDLTLSDDERTRLIQLGSASVSNFFENRVASNTVAQSFYRLPRTFGSLPAHDIHSVGRKGFCDDLERSLKDLDHPTLLLDRCDKDAREILINLAQKMAAPESGFKLIFWIDGSTPELWEKGIKGLGRALKVVEENEKKCGIKKSLNRYILKIVKKLREEEYFQPWLLMVDRLNQELSDEEKQLLLHNNGGKVILSAKANLLWRREWLENEKVVLKEIPYLTDNEALDLIANSQQLDPPENRLRLLNYFKEQMKGKITPRILRRVFEQLSSRRTTISEFLEEREAANRDLIQHGFLVDLSGQDIKDVDLKKKLEEKFSLLPKDLPIKLNLSNNQLTDNSFRHLYPYWENLISLDLRNNQLTSFIRVRQWFTDSRLEELNLKGNPINNVVNELTQLCAPKLERLTYDASQRLKDGNWLSKINECNINAQKQILKAFLKSPSFQNIKCLTISSYDKVEDEMVHNLATTLSNLPRINLKWRKINPDHIQILTEMVKTITELADSSLGKISPFIALFGPKEWQHYLGVNITEIPPLPEDLISFLNSPEKFSSNPFNVFSQITLILIPDFSVINKFSIIIDNLENNRLQDIAAYVKVNLLEKKPRQGFWLIEINYQPLKNEEKTTIIETFTGLAKQTEGDYRYFCKEDQYKSKIACKIYQKDVEITEEDVEITEEDKTLEIADIEIGRYGWCL